MSRPVAAALVGMGWWGKKMLNVLAAAPAEIRVVRAVEPNIETVRALCADKGVALTADYADALADPEVEAATFEILETQKIIESKARITLIPGKGGILPELLASIARFPESSRPLGPVVKVATQT